MPKRHRKDCKELHPRVHRLMSPLNPLLLIVFLLPRTSQHRTRTFCFPGGLCDVPVIRLNPLRRLQEGHQTVSEDCYVRVFSSGVRAVEPLDVPLENPKANFVAESRFALELVGGKVRASLWDSAVGAVHTKVSIVVGTNDPRIEINLTNKGEFHERVN